MATAHQSGSSSYRHCHKHCSRWYERQAPHPVHMRTRQSLLPPPKGAQPHADTIAALLLGTQPPRIRRNLPRLGRIGTIDAISGTPSPSPRCSAKVLGGRVTTSRHHHASMDGSRPGRSIRDALGLCTRPTSPGGHPRSLARGSASSASRAWALKLRLKP